MGADSSKGAAPVDPAVLAKQYDLTVEQVNEAIALWPKVFICFPPLPSFFLT